MANYVVIDPTIGAAYPVSATETSQRFPLGYLARGADQRTGTANVGAGQFIYCQGSNVASAGQAVHIVNNSAVLLASANSASFYPIGFAAGVLSATNAYGWVQVQGIVDNAKVTNIDGAAGVRICLAATAGQVATGTALGSRIQGIIAPVSWTSTQSASVTLQVYHPFVIGITGSN